MEEIMDEITIYEKNGLRYRKFTTKKGKLRSILLCLTESCSKDSRGKPAGYYCFACLNEICGYDQVKRDKIININNEKIERIYEKIKKDEKLELEKSKILINGIEIYIKNTVKYIKKEDGQLFLACPIDGCTNPRANGQYGHFCTTHKKGTDPTSPQRIRDIEERKEKRRTREEKVKLNKLNEFEKSKIIINGVEIYIKNNLKYKKSSSGRFVLVCFFDGCTNLKECGNFCLMHKNGTEPNSPERIKEKEKLLETQKKNGRETGNVGNSTELWVLEKLNILDNIYDVENIGFSSSIYDIIYKLNNENESRGIQVKTLSKSTKKLNSYFFANKNTNYGESILFIGVTKDRSKFVLGYYKDFKDKERHSFNFSNTDPNYRYKKNIFTDYNLFIENLRIMLSKTDICEIENIKSKWIKREAESLDRLSKKCNNFSLTYGRVKDARSPIDCIINNYNIQHKSSENSNSNTYQFNLCKSDGGQKKQAYSDKDGIDFFVFEIIPFKNNFYIVPIKEFFERGYIRTDNSKGKVGFCIPCPKKANRDNWINKYLNYFDLLKTPKNIQQ